MKNTIKILILAILVSIPQACSTPNTFVRTMDPNWNVVQIRDDLTYDEAWNSVVDLISKKFDIEILSKEDGYLRTGWSHSWTGELDEAYKVRAIIKFTPDQTRLEIKSEAHHYSSGFMGMGSGWEMGTDERLVTTLRSDIMGKVGRVTR